MMRLIGYIKQLKTNSFTIPIYTDGKKMYFHFIDLNFKIIGFEEIKSNYNFEKLFSNENYRVGSKGAIVFVGEEKNVFYGKADKTIYQIELYIESLNVKQNKYIIEEIKELKNQISVRLSSKRKSIEMVNYDSLKKIDDSNINHLINKTKKINITRHNLSEYYEVGFLEIINSKKKEIGLSLNIIPDDVIKRWGLHSKDKEILFHFFSDFINDNNSQLYQTCLNEIRKQFSKFLIEKNKQYKTPEITPMEMSIEDTLRVRAEERRKKMKQFNYKFHIDVNKIDEFEREPAYKRMGIDLDSSSSNLSTFYIPIHDFTQNTRKQEDMFWKNLTNFNID